MYLQISNHQGIETWCITRPERGNALGTSLSQELLARCHVVGLLHQNIAPQAPKALILTAKPAGKTAAPIWIAGGDLKELSLLHNSQEAKIYAQSMGRVCQALCSWPIPIIAAIHGRAIGGGAELALAADIRLGTSATTFEFRQLKMGLSTGYGSAAHLVALVGLAKAQELLFLNRLVDAPECRTLGLLHEILPNPEELAKRSAQIAETLGLETPQAFAAQKRMFALPPTNSTRNLEEEIFVGIWRNPAHVRSLEAFLESKSQP